MVKIISIQEAYKRKFERQEKVKGIKFQCFGSCAYVGEDISPGCYPCFYSDAYSYGFMLGRHVGLPNVCNRDCVYCFEPHQVLQSYSVPDEWTISEEQKGRARGTRTIAGSLVFTVFDRHVLWDVMRREHGDNARNSVTQESGYADLEYTLSDQLPPFDIVIHFVNEYGHAAEMVIYGIELSAEGQVMSIQDLITENTMQYTARHMAIMRPGGHKKIKPVVSDQYGNPINTKESPTFRTLVASTTSAETKRLIALANNPFR